MTLYDERVAVVVVTANVFRIRLPEAGRHPGGPASASGLPRLRSGCAGKEGFEVLACDDAAPADLQVGQLAGAYLVIQQVAGEPGDRRSLIDAVGQSLVRVRPVHAR